MVVQDMCGDRRAGGRRPRLRGEAALVLAVQLTISGPVCDQPEPEPGLEPKHTHCSHVAQSQAAMSLLNVVLSPQCSTHIHNNIRAVGTLKSRRRTIVATEARGLPLTCIKFIRLPRIQDVYEGCPSASLVDE